MVIGTVLHAATTIMEAIEVVAVAASLDHHLQQKLVRLPPNLEAILIEMCSSHIILETVGIGEKKDGVVPVADSTTIQITYIA